uniref:Uncharacterized protein n=1 Tax=Solanum tuberosum TaxID=4113 RepID=M1ATX9_SOLTU
MLLNFQQTLEQVEKDLFLEIQKVSASSLVRSPEGVQEKYLLQEYNRNGFTSRGSAFSIL